MVSKEEDIAKISKRLDKLISNKDADNVAGLDYLKILENADMSLEVLTKTRIGMIVNNFRRATTSSEMSLLSKNLIRKWKKLVPVVKEESKDKKVNGDKKKESERPVTPKQEPPPKSTTAYVSPSSYYTSDSVRLKCREMLMSSLDGEMPKDCSPDLSEIVSEIEDAVYNFCKQHVDNKYKNRIRSRISNLRDKKNPLLRENVLMGHISGKEFAIMSAEDMASSEMKSVREKFVKEGINDSQMAITAGTATDLLKCPKCHKRNCTYNQLQTRSSDEPMTTFCFCNDCGKRWKFC